MILSVKRGARSGGIVGGSPTSKNDGFTLIELMITVAIVGILAAIAYPSYQSHVVKSWRANASACLLELANRMERRFTGSRAYNDPGDVPSSECATEPGMQDRYEFGFHDDPDLSATAFSLKATPIGAQGDDPCNILTINHWGQKGVVGAGSGWDVDRCWRR